MRVPGKGERERPSRGSKLGKAYVNSGDESSRGSLPFQMLADEAKGSWLEESVLTGEDLRPEGFERDRGAGGYASK